MVVVDSLTKRVHLIPTTTTATAVETAELFFKEIVRLHGVPEKIVSDRDSKFLSDFWRQLFALLDTRLAMSTSYHPQTDGATERVNRVIEETLRNYVQYQQHAWAAQIPYVEMSINSAMHRSTGMTPFEADLGYMPKLPLGALRPTSNPSVADFVGHLQQINNRIRDNLLVAQQRMAEQANKGRREEVDYREGQLVLVNSKNFVAPPDANQPSRKLLPRWVGPFPIARKVSPVAFKLKLPDHYRIHPVFHVSLLKAYEKGEGKIEVPPAEWISGRQYYEVELILDSRVRRKKREYLVKWKGFPFYDSTWEPSEHLHLASVAVKEFEDSRKSRESSSPPAHQ
jgi:hypothetical protein